MRNTIRTFLSFEAMTFVVASLIHGGMLIEGYEHHEAHLADVRGRGPRESGRVAVDLADHQVEALVRGEEDLARLVPVGVEAEVAQPSVLAAHLKRPERRHLADLIDLRENDGTLRIL